MPIEATPAARSAPKPEGVLELSRFQNTIPYNDTCANVILYFANRSNAAVQSSSVHFHEQLDNGRTIDLGWRTVQLGLPAFGSNTYHEAVCDSRLGGQQYGPSAVPDRITWRWY